MLYNVFKMFAVRLLLISVLLYNTEARFSDEYDGATGSTGITMNATIPEEDRTPTNLTETIDGYYGSVTVEKNNTLYYESIPVEDPSAMSDRTAANLTYEFAITKPYEDENGYLNVAHLPKKDYEKENNSKKVDWPYNWLFGTVTSTRRPDYSNRYDEFGNDKNMTETSYNRYNKTVVDSETTRRPYHSNRYDGRQTEHVTHTTTRRKHVYTHHRWWPKDVETTTIPRNLTTTAPDGYNVDANDTGYYITTTDVNYNWVASVSPIVNNSTDRNVTNKAITDQVNSKTPTSGRNPVNIMINSSINGNVSKTNELFTDFFKKVSGYILPSARHIAPNSNVTNLAVADGNGNSFFYAYNLVIG